ncbi:MAG: amino-acid N-acetyltransferase [Thiofilum sp.]|uniref:amino-acid N-acetyltransferase n=1 Tax=Thiofilum sp. TaxID=2212733 RepID=UPI0025FE58F3|nr:amino-acid N-acetyltransferase [Thiofilum sp.]MBK8452545.1 amino-acid N-acetyltransferase [Thiofilum sp.]
MSNSDTTDCLLNRVNLLREIGPYIQRHRTKTFVIAFAGEVVEQPTFRRFIQDIAIIASLDVRIVLIHGTRPQIDSRIIEDGGQPVFHNGLRITDKDALLAVKEACGYLRVKIENLLTSALHQPQINNNSLDVISGNFLSAKPIGVHDGIDYKYTGQVRKVNVESITEQLSHENVVLISPIGYSPTGESYNLGYEQTAIATASALKANKLIFITHEPIPIPIPNAMSRQEAEALGERMPLLKQIAKAVSHDIERVHIIESTTDGGLLLELYTREGVGSMISNESIEKIRPAVLDDISGIIELIRPLEQEGILVRRSREQLELELGNFHVVEVDQQIVGCAALYQTDDLLTSELACVAVHPQYRANHRGDRLVNYMQQLALKLGKQKILVLTTQTSDWFKERGFEEKSVEDLPENKKRLYNYKRNSRVLIKSLLGKS